jgi:hypothetical protein
MIALWAVIGNIQALTALTPVMLLGMGGFIWVGSVSLSHWLEARSTPSRRRPTFPAYLPVAPGEPQYLARKPAAE